MTEVKVETVEHVILDAELLDNEFEGFKEFLGEVIEREKALIKAVLITDSGNSYGGWYNNLKIMYLNPEYTRQKAAFAADVCNKAGWDVNPELMAKIEMVITVYHEIEHATHEEKEGEDTCILAQINALERVKKLPEDFDLAALILTDDEIMRLARMVEDGFFDQQIEQAEKDLEKLEAERLGKNEETTEETTAESAEAAEPEVEIVNEEDPVEPPDPIYEQQHQEEVIDTTARVIVDETTTDLTFEQMEDILIELSKRMYSHIFNNCGFNAGRFNNPENVITQGIDISDIPGAAGFIIRHKTANEHGGTGMVDTHGVINGFVSPKIGLPAYTFYINVKGTILKRTFIPQNPDKADEMGNLKKWSQAARNGAMIAYMYKGEGGVALTCYLEPGGAPEFTKRPFTDQAVSFNPYEGFTGA